MGMKVYRSINTGIHMGLIKRLHCIQRHAVRGLLPINLQNVAKEGMAPKPVVVQSKYRGTLKKLEGSQFYGGCFPSNFFKVGHFWASNTRLYGMHRHSSWYTPLVRIYRVFAVF